jgi:hypothetical protein
MTLKRDIMIKLLQLQSGWERAVTFIGTSALEDSETVFSGH